MRRDDERTCQVLYPVATFEGATDHLYRTCGTRIETWKSLCREHWAEICRTAPTLAATMAGKGGATGGDIARARHNAVAHLELRDRLTYEGKMRE